MKILITGGLGHIGSYLVENIDKIKNVKEIFVIDNFATSRYCSLFNLPKTKKKIHFFEKDLSIKDSLKTFQKVDVVINLASLTDAASSLKIKKEMYKNNLGIFHNIIKYCKRNSSKLIHISSTSVYGEQKGIVDESCKELKPKSPYAEIKVKEENILKNNRKKIKFITLRFGTISGVSKGMRFHTAINKFCFYVSLNKPLPIWKSMMHKHRPYLSLSDSFKAIKFIVENNFFNTEVYNVLSKNLTLFQIINYFKMTKKKIKIKYEDSKLINQYSYFVSNKRFTKKAFLLKANIAQDIKDTLKMLSNINNEV